MSSAVTDQTPLVKLTGLYENVSKDGRTYYSGLLGVSKILLLKDRNQVEGKPGWSLMVAPRPLDSHFKCNT